MSAIQQMLVASGRGEPPSIRATTGVLSAGSSSLTVPAVTCENGDMILLFVANYGPPWDTPSGYTLLLTSPSAGSLSSPSRYLITRVFYRVVDWSLDSSTTITGSTNLTLGAKVAIKSTTPINFHVSTATEKTGTGASIGAAIPITTEGNALYIAAIVLGKSFSGYTITTYPSVSDTTLVEVGHKTQAFAVVAYGLTLVSAHLEDARPSTTKYTLTASSTVYDLGTVSTLVLTN